MGWDKVQRLLTEGVDLKIFSGAVAAIKTLGKTPHVFVAGETRSDEKALPVTPQTIFDLASLTKVLATTTIVARLADQAKISLAEKVISILSDLPWEEDWAETTVEDLLTHRSGFSAWRDFSQEIPEPQRHDSETSRKTVFASLARMKPEMPPRTQSHYSDLGFMLLGLWLERRMDSTLEELLREEVCRPLNCDKLFFRPLRHGVMASEIAATEDIAWRGGVIQGEVDDNNAYLLGGVAAHAGLFGSVGECMKIGEAWIKAYHGDTSFLSSKVAKQFTTRWQAPQRSRFALGWDTPEKEASSAGKKISQEAVGHLGYTGTSVWLDLEPKTLVFLLTNRVHLPTEKSAIQSFRPRFYDAVWEEIK